jgi:hypothetical protein
MTAERPKCIEGKHCVDVRGGRVLVTGHLEFPNAEIGDEGRGHCRLYDKWLFRSCWNIDNVVRCAACRRDWPNEEMPK